MNTRNLSGIAGFIALLFILAVNLQPQDDWRDYYPVPQASASALPTTREMVDTGMVDEENDCLDGSRAVPMTPRIQFDSEVGTRLTYTDLLHERVMKMLFKRIQCLERHVKALEAERDLADPCGLQSVDCDVDDDR